MNGTMNENQLTMVKQYEFEIPLSYKKHSIIDIYFTDCHNKYIHLFENECVYYIKPTNFGNNERVNLNLLKKARSYINEKKISKCSAERFYI